jgi:hypothetical protein
MILVDTSALVSFLRGSRTPAALLLERLETDGEPFALAHVIVQECLAGARDAREWSRLLAYLASQELLAPRDPLATHVAAARIFFDCRRRGWTVRSPVDCFVAQLAVEHGAAVLHEDRDYGVIARVRALRTLP